MTKADETSTYSKCGQSLGTVPEILTPQESDFLLLTLEVKGDPSIFKAGTGKCVFQALCSGKWDQLETDATDASESNRQGVNPAATIYPPHDFSGSNSLKLLQTKNLMSCSKSRAVPTLYWVTSQLPVTFFFFTSIKQSKEDLKKKGG